jgi:apolipoprotein N-acyltransferase
MGETLVGDVICFEIAYDDVVREVARGGAEMLVVQTNNATYMGTGQIEQQFDIARLRAIETGRHVVVVATNGVSGIIAPDGHVVARAPVRTQAVLTHTLPVVEGLTPALRWGRTIDVLLATGAGLALVAALLAGRRSRRPEESAPGSEPDRAAVPAGAGRR